MAQQDAMEQVKEVVRQIIKYRFWISISVAALFGVIAYFMGAGPVRAKADAETKKITAAEKEVQTYATPTIPTKEYQPIVEEKTQVLSKDVNTAWKTLYDRQAPLLTWPDTVQERFQKWGRKWPEDVDPGKVTLAQIDYIAAYKDYVDMVYSTFKPFNYETGEGIVVAPPKEVLLRPAVFSDDQVPGLTKIWSAQERLWIQRTLLEVVNEVNKNANAKDWNSAIIREIEALEVGSPVAQDQRSIANGETLEESSKILAPGETEDTEAAAPASSPMAAMGGGGGRRGGESMGGGMRGMGGGAASDTQSVYYVKAGNDQQYKILPVEMTVLIDQDHVQDLLVELENSPMSIQVMDFELQRPMTRVTKPEKGVMQSGGYGGMMGMGGRGMMGMMGAQARGMSGFGGMMGQMQAGRMGSMAGMGMMGMGGRGGAVAEHKGIDNRNKEKRSVTRKKEEEAINKSKGPSLFDPYFDIVQVTVYGQARFFNPPPESPAVEPSPGETAAAGDAAADTKTANAPAAADKGASAPEKAAAPADEKAAAKPDVEAGADAEKKAAAAAPAPAGAAAGKVEGAPSAGTGKAAEPPAAAPAGAPAKAAAASKPATAAPDAKGESPKP